MAWKKAWALGRKGAGALLDLVLPPTCPVTGERVAAPGLLSGRGFAALQFIDDPVCARCGAPFAHDEGGDAVCAPCAAEPPHFDRARAAVLYDDASRRLIVAFKHSDRTELAPLLARLLRRAGAPFVDPAAVVIPCPLHPFRLIERRYNQAALLAAAFARDAGIDYAPDALRRIRRTAPHKALGVQARRRNVAGAFALTEAAAARIRGRPALLVDDVLTTGATLSACARALKKAGAARVDALVLARVLKTGVAALG